MLTPPGEELLGRAEAVEASADAFAEAASAGARDISGTVRVTSEELYALSLISPLLRDLHEQHPEIIVEVDTTGALRDLGAGEADIALRSSSHEQPAGLVGRRLCIDDWTLYCSRDYAARHGRPTTAAELKRHAIIGGGGGEALAALPGVAEKPRSRGSGRDAPRELERTPVRDPVRFRHRRSALHRRGREIPI